MINITAYISSKVDDLMRRIVKLRRLGKDDVQTSIQAGPHGIDSNPVKDMRAIYLQTGSRKKTVVVGYLNQNALAEVGGSRLFSTNDKGEEQAAIYMRANGDIELGGTDDFAVRFNELKAGFDQLVSDHNNTVTALNSLITAYNAHVHPVPLADAVAPSEGSQSLPTPASASPDTPSTATIDSAKIETIKTR
jgi:hypothetical protein